MDNFGYGKVKKNGSKGFKKEVEEEIQEDKKEAANTLRSMKNKKV